MQSKSPYRTVRGLCIASIFGMAVFLSFYLIWLFTGYKILNPIWSFVWFGVSLECFLNLFTLRNEVESILRKFGVSKPY